MNTGKIGEINELVINILDLSLETATPIFIGETNLSHMQSEHPEDFEKYGDKIEEILASPDYVAKHPRKDSIEYIKVYFDEQKEKRVLVAVRATGSGKFYARTLFVMSDTKVEKYKEKDAFHEYKR
ncbi:PBECR2 nuclease fold domain-containing protein [Bacillus cereus]|nr:PBECR2 nuclease fold domain-containing protein [Bacillus cereus]MDA2136486.1 PBECR2 nuclease fold domain-containing protein [Bacillus cereus]